MSKPSIPKGTRDFLPSQMAKRNYIFDIARSVFKKFGFQQIETPAVENLKTLTGKYGDEGDQLMFKILNRGDKFKKAVKTANEGTKETDFTELALRYDLTVPFARFVVQNQNDLTFPFKRFQIQPVWRADRPGKGRYREFFQCDVDVIGTDSLLCEVELIQIFNEILTTLKIPTFKIKINNRKILSGIAEVIGEIDKIVDITVAIDKLDKIGLEQVNKEMSGKGVSNSSIEKLQPIIKLSGSLSDKINALKEFLKNSEIGMQGVKELEYIFKYCKSLGVESSLELDVTLARGLNYYTGAIFEVVSEGFKGSISGGGRYDGLTDMFGLKGVSGVGISLGADRIYDILLENDLFPKNELEALDVFFVNFGDTEERFLMPLVGELRSKGVSVEVYPSSNAKMKKQMSYADSKKARYVVLIGESEIDSGLIRVKEMSNGNQVDITFKKFLQNF